MNILIISLGSWLDLGVKLIFLLTYTMALWIYAQKLAPKSLPLPLFFIASLPFFLPYKIAIALGKGSILNELYTAIALLGFAVLLILAIRRPILGKSTLYQYGNLFRQHRIFSCLLILIFIFFCMRGLYLEYPGDAITYLERVGQANQDSPVNISSLWNYNSTINFFSSLQQWLVGTDYLLRAKLRFIAAFSACMLCVSTYRLSLWTVRRHQTIGVLTVLLFLGFYGNLQISFFLYKILQGATLAMIIYLEIIPIVYSFLSNIFSSKLFSSVKLFELCLITLATWLCLDCHKEKVFYLFAIIYSYVFLQTTAYSLNKRRPPVLIILIFLLIFAYIIVLFVSGKPPIYPLPPLTHEWFSVSQYTVFSYWPSPPNSSLILLDLMIFGLAIILITNYSVQSKYFFMAAIAIAPFLFFLNPIVMTGFIKLTNPVNLYRLMIGGLPWIFLPLACYVLQRDKAVNLFYVPVVFIFLGLLAYAPIYGKLPHLLNRVPSYANGQDLAPVVNHLLEVSNRQDRVSLNIMATPYVNAYLAAWQNFSVNSSRWISNDLAVYGPAGAELAYFYSSDITDNEITETINAKDLDVIIIDHRDELSYWSWLGRMTQHWSPDLISSQQILFAGHSLRSYLENQPQLIFEKTFEKNGFQIYQRDLS
ncbi:MAG: hypothetical protein AAGD09_00660 [Cyanobacteria bacterium P01_F01_bin.56]